MNDVKWAKVSGYPQYEVSSEGDLRCWTSRNGRGMAKKPHPVACVIGAQGYVQAKLYSGGRQCSFNMHRLIAIAFWGLPSPKHQVNHKNGVKRDNRLVNLEWVTHKENAMHSCRVLKNGIGEKNSFAKLTDAQVAEIRARYAAGGVFQRELAAEYGVSGNHIHRLVNGKSRAQ